MASKLQYLRTVEFLLDEDAEGRMLLALEDTAAFIAMEDSTLAIVIFPSKRGAELLDALSHQLGLNPKVHHKLVMVGGGVDTRAVLEACQPGVLGRRMVQVYQLSDDGEIWSGRSSRLDSGVGRALVAARDARDPIDAASLATRIRRPSENEAHVVREHRGFVRAYKELRPSVTIGAVALLLGVFGLQMTWGGGSFLPTLVRMGANTEASLTTEPWRLLASTLLHGGWTHVGMNALALYMLGSYFERVVGWRRMLVLLVLSGLAGAIASSMRNEVLVSVGASGAILGLLGGAAGIAWKPRGLVPDAIVGNLRRAVGLNVVLCTGLSFLPGVDFMAHLGGATVGAALVLSGLLTRGLRPLTDDPARRHDRGRAWTWSAWGLSALTVGCFAAACVTGRPWELGRPPVVVDVPLEGTPYVVRGPEGAVVRALRGDSVSFQLGDPLVSSFSLEVVRGGHRGATAQDWIDQPCPLEEGAERISRTVVHGEGPPSVDEVHRYPNGVVYVRCTLREDEQIAVAAFVLSGARDDVDRAARAAAQSLRCVPGLHRNPCDDLD